VALEKRAMYNSIVLMMYVSTPVHFSVHN
jgi:hypothetical protein